MKYDIIYNIESFVGGIKLKHEDIYVNDIFNSSLDIIANRIKEILYLIENTEIVSNISNSYKLVRLKDELIIIQENIKNIFNCKSIDIIDLNKFSLVIYYIAMSLLEYLKSISKNQVLINNINTNILKLEEKHTIRINSYIKALKLSIDKVQNIMI